METRDITERLIAAGLGVDLVYEGPISGCPHCVDREASRPAEAA